MDGFELLLQASQPSNNFEGGFTLSPNKMAFPSTEKIHSSLLDPIDSIMMLADQALKQEHQPSSSPPLPSWKDYGPYFNGQNDRRLRAMSEPWTTQDSMNVSLKYGLMGAATTFLSFEGGSTKSMSSSNLSVTSPHTGSSPPPGAQHQLEQTLPHMLDKYAAIYNKHGRVGIYTKEERIAIVSRFREKRKRRVWRKKIRYFCRKNLADRRVRVKGRFVKAGGKVSAEDTNGAEAHEENSSRLMIKLKRGAAGVLSPMEEVEEEDDEYEYGDEQEEYGGYSGDEAGIKSESNTTNSTSSNTPPSNSASYALGNVGGGGAAGVGGECKLHFLSSMLGDYIEEELNHTGTASEGSSSSSFMSASYVSANVGKGLAPSPEEFGPGGKKMRRHSIAY